MWERTWLQTMGMPRQDCYIYSIFDFIPLNIYIYIYPFFENHVLESESNGVDTIDLSNAMVTMMMHTSHFSLVLHRTTWLHSSWGNFRWNIEIVWKAAWRDASSVKAWVPIRQVTWFNHFLLPENPTRCWESSSLWDMNQYDIRWHMTWFYNITLKMFWTTNSWCNR